MSNRRVQIDRLAYGPQGVARDDGKVVFVRNTAPGDVVEISIDEDHGSYAYASAQHIIEASPIRRIPPCPYPPRCGGCPWQHVAYAAQLRAKEDNIADHLRRIAGLTAPPLRPILPSPLEYGYRSRLSLRTESGRIGFYAAGSHDLVEVERCLLGGEILNRALPHVAGIVRALRSAVRRVQVIQCTVPDADAVSLLGEVEGELCAADVATIASFIDDSHPVRGVTLHGKGWRRSWGEEVITINPEEELRLSARSGAFTQVNPLANRRLVEQVVTLGAFAAGERVLDLYAGIGNLTFPIARRAAHVIAVEQDRVATLAAQENARHLHANNVEVIHASAHRALSRWRRHPPHFDVVVVDPPRSGIAEITDHLLELGAARLIYVSCNPPTLARDLKRLAARYRVEAIQPIDLFPHTYHVEVVVQCTLRSR